MSCNSGSDSGLVARTDFKSDGPGLILGMVGSIPTHFRHSQPQPRTDGRSVGSATGTHQPIVAVVKTTSRG